MDNDYSEKRFICVNKGCWNPITLGLFCSVECAVEYGAYSRAKGWIMSDKVLDSIPREEYIEEEKENRDV